MDDKHYYRISEAVEILGIENPSVIRHWEKTIKMLNPKKSGNGNRLYTQKDIELLVKIKRYKSDGYTLDGINKALLKEKMLGKINRVQLVEKMKEIRDFLQSLQTE